MQISSIAGLIYERWDENRDVSARNQALSKLPKICCSSVSVINDNA